MVKINSTSVYLIKKAVFSQKTQRNCLLMEMDGEEFWNGCSDAVKKFLETKPNCFAKITDIDDKGNILKVQIVDVGAGDAGTSGTTPVNLPQPVAGGYAKAAIHGTQRVQQIKIIGGLQKADVEREANEFYKTHKVFATNPMSVAIDEGIMLILVIYYEV
jgi:hypothetical protein